MGRPVTLGSVLAAPLTLAEGNVVGIGVDLTDIAEFTRLPFDPNRPFYRRVFTAAEISYCLSQADPARHFAARFAAKEAAVKAFRSVVELGYWQIEVVRDEVGAPNLV